MNHYGQIALECWITVAPSHVAALENPEEFFTKLGERVLAHVKERSVRFHESAPQNENEVAKAVRIAADWKLAEELVVRELVQIPRELARVSERAKVEVTRLMDKRLLEWVRNIQELGKEPSTDELETWSIVWSLSAGLLRQLLEAGHPGQLVESNAKELQERVDAAWGDFLKAQLGQYTLETLPRGLDSLPAATHRAARD